MARPRTAFFVSDRTGITAEMLGHSLLTQFDDVRFNEVTVPFVDTLEKAREVVAKINQQGAADGERPIVISTLAGVQTMDARLLEVGRNYGAAGARLFWKVILPAALPAIFTGLRLGLGLALVALVAVEFIAAKSGLGHLVYRHWQMLSTPEMYAAFALVGGLGLALTRGLRALQARLLAWQDDIGV